MGTPLAFFANIVMGNHKKQTVTPTHKPQIVLLFSLVDDQFGIFIQTDDDKNIHVKYEKYCTNLNMVIPLTWECYTLIKTVDLLDLTISILPNGNLNF